MFVKHSYNKYLYTAIFDHVDIDMDFCKGGLDV